MLARNFGELLIFMAVVDAGSFVGGSRSMGLTRSAASKAVGRLEDRLGVRLLHRTTRVLSLTEEGRAFFDRARTAVAAVEEAEASVADRRGTPRGVLRITVPDTFGRRVILPMVGRYLAAWPDLRAQVSFADRRADLVEEGFDLAVRIDGSVSDSRLVSRIVARCERVLVASPDYLGKRGEPKDPESLADHDRLLFFSRGQRQNWRLRDGAGVWQTVQGNARLRLDNGEALRDAAAAGLGIALLPIFLVADDLEADRLRRVLPDAVATDVEISAIYPTRRLLEPRVRRFIDLMVDELSASRWGSERS